MVEFCILALYATHAPKDYLHQHPKRFWEKGKAVYTFWNKSATQQESFSPPQIKETLIFSRFLCILSSRVAGWKKSIERRKPTPPATEIGLNWKQPDRARPLSQRRVCAPHTAPAMHIKKLSHPLLLFLFGVSRSLNANATAAAAHSNHVLPLSVSERAAGPAAPRRAESKSHLHKC